MSLSVQPDVDPGRTGVIRVFVSSTFRDMRDERDHLVKFVFPDLRRRCLERGLEFAAVDLRWGVSSEQDALEVCLDEIARCQIFIGLLGERHGFVPSPVEGETPGGHGVEMEPGASLTELEIAVGALDRPTSETSAFIYLRDPEYAHTRGGDFVEADPEGRRRVAELKSRIRMSGIPCRSAYRDIEELGGWVLEDIGLAIDRLAPPALADNPTAREDAAHRRLETVLRLSHVGLEDVLERLDGLTAPGGPPVLVSGPPGCGKSSLLAAWAERRRALDPVVVVHHVEATDRSSSWPALAGRVARCLSESCDPRPASAEPVGDEAGALHAAFDLVDENDGRCIVILDGLDSLDDDPGAHALHWLPTDVPRGVSLVLSARGGTIADQVAARGWRRLEMRGLNAAERVGLARTYLSRYGKSLDDRGCRTIRDARATSAPRFLLTLLNEIRQWGDFLTLGEQIGRLSACDDLYDLAWEVLDRLERDFEGSRPGLVRDALSLLWAVPRGMSESEILEALGTEAALPQAQFAPVHLAMEGLVESPAGLIRLSDDQVRAAVEERYLVDPADRRRAHASAAAVFAGAPLTTRTARALPAQLIASDQDRALFDLLTDPDSLTVLHDAAPLALRRHWAYLDRRGLPLTYGATSVMDHLLRLPGDARSAGLPALAVLAELLNGVDARMAAGLWRLLAEESGATGRTESLLRALHGLRAALRQTGPDEELRAVEDRIAALRAQHPVPGQGSDPLSEATRIGRLAQAAFAADDAAQAIELYDRQATILRRLGVTDALAICLANKAAALAGEGRFETAVLIAEEQERVLQDLGDRVHLQASLNNKACWQIELGRLDDAEATLEAQESLSRLIGSEHGLVDCVAVRAAVHARRGDARRARDVLQHAVREARQHGLHQQCAIYQQALESGPAGWFLRGPPPRPTPIPQESKE